MNQTRWPASNRRIQSTVAALAASLCVAAPVLASSPNASGQGQANGGGQGAGSTQTPPGQQQATVKQEQKAAVKQQRQSTKQPATTVKQSQPAVKAPQASSKARARGRAVPAAQPRSVTVKRVAAARKAKAAATTAAARRARQARRARRARRAAAVAAAGAAATAPAAETRADHKKKSIPTRSNGGSPQAPGAKAKPDTKGPVATVSQQVSDIVQVFPKWARALFTALAALLFVALVTIVSSALRNRRLRALSARLRDEVGTLSAAVLPIVPERVGVLAASVAYRPAAGLAAGGDFYDVFALDRGRVGIVVGDVSGHGREALGPATFFRHMVRSYLKAGLGPRAALNLAGKVVDDHNSDDFATVIAAIHDPSAGTVSYASAGHPPPIFTGPGAHRPLVAASSPPIGIGDPTGMRQTTVAVAPMTQICFFTDGLFEARYRGGQFGEGRLERIVEDLGPYATAQDLIDRVEEEVDEMPDDVAVCMIRIEGGAPTASSLRVEEIEVSRVDFDTHRVEHFLEACGVDPDEIPRVIDIAGSRALTDGAVVLRVRLAEERSGVDILSVDGVEEARTEGLAVRESV